MRIVTYRTDTSVGNQYQHRKTQNVTVTCWRLRVNGLKSKGRNFRGQGADRVRTLTLYLQELYLFSK
jgi:hypothetical protein